mgnify:FL=1
MSVASDYRRWAAIHDNAMARAMAALDDDTTAEELAETVRQADRRLREIPPRVRAMEACMATAERLVDVLGQRGIHFANTTNAPAQLAGSMYAAWIWHDHHGVEDNADWLAVMEACAAAVAWAVDHADTAHPLAQRLVADVLGEIPAELADDGGAS